MERSAFSTLKPSSLGLVTLCHWLQGPAHQPGRGAVLPTAQQHGQPADHLPLHPHLLHLSVLPEVKPLLPESLLLPHLVYPIGPSLRFSQVRVQKRLVFPPSYLHPDSLPVSHAWAPAIPLAPCHSFGPMVFQCDRDPDALTAERGQESGLRPAGVCGSPPPSLSAFQHRLARTGEHLRVFHPWNHGEQNVDGAHCGEAGAARKARGGFQVCVPCLRCLSWT